VIHGSGQTDQIEHGRPPEDPGIREACSAGSAGLLRLCRGWLARDGVGAVSLATPEKGRPRQLSAVTFVWEVNPLL